MAGSTVYLSRLLGVVLLIAAVLMLVDKDVAIATAVALGQDRGATLVLGIVRVLFGASIVLIHNVWTKGVWPLVVTLCGWLLMIRGIVILFLPRDVFGALVVSANVTEFYYLYAAIPLLLGAYLCLRGFSTRPAPPPAAEARPLR
ncbi:MAG TPA: hypothetical protein VET89_15035 [Stellaceae bacterium]|nr:hypothetical protein [Stellaceae bacterium]